MVFKEPNKRKSIPSLYHKMKHTEDEEDNGTTMDIETMEDNGKTRNMKNTERCTSTELNS